MPSTGASVTRDYTLQPSSKQLSEVTVTADRATVMADKTVYRFTKEQREAARNSAELMEQVGTLTIDPISGRLQDIDGTGVRILINGVNSTLNDLRSIPTDKIRKVDVYTLPPAKYATSSQQVINAITAQLDSGTSGGFDVTSAVATGFVNGNAFINYISGNHRLSADYNIELRDYDDRRTNSFYTYYLGGKTYTYDYDMRDHFGYTYHTPRLKYTYARPDDWTVQVTATPAFNKRFSHGNETVRLSDDPDDATAHRDRNSTTFSPSLDVYLSKQLNKNSEITANVVGTYFHSSQDNDNSLDAGHRLTRDLHRPDAPERQPLLHHRRDRLLAPHGSQHAQCGSALIGVTVVVRHAQHTLRLRDDPLPLRRHRQLHLCRILGHMEKNHVYG